MGSVVYLEAVTSIIWVERGRFEAQLSYWEGRIIFRKKWLFFQVASESKIMDEASLDL